MRCSRRSFLKTTVATGSLAVSLRSTSFASGANDQIRIAVIGLNGRGGSHLRGFKDHVVALCDCDARVLGAAAESFTNRTQRKVDAVQDYRKLLERSDIDAVSIATPNHTHALIAIEACLAGKDVYVEKPVSHNVWEGRQLVNAARKYQRIVQAGTQCRSSRSLHEAHKFITAGKLGAIQYAVGTCYKPRQAIGSLSRPLQIPAHIDYDLWCGPAAKVDLYRPRLHYDWHWDFNTGNGDMGNQGIHQMDLARWFLGEDALSPFVLSVGGRLGYEDAGDTPNTQTVIHNYAKAPLIFETRGLPKRNIDWSTGMDNYRGSGVGVVVQCEQGRLLIPTYTDAIAYDSDGNVIQKWSGGGDHFANFLTAVRSRNAADLNADILEGHLSSGLCHTGGISHQLGSKMPGHSIVEAVSESQAAGPLFSESLERMARHLDANKIDLSEATLTLGAPLEMDAAAEQFVSNQVANRSLTRAYRKPFVVPDLSF